MYSYNTAIFLIIRPHATKLFTHTYTQQQTDLLTARLMASRSLAGDCIRVCVVCLLVGGGRGV